MDYALTFRRHKSNLKKTIGKLFFLFHLGNSMFIIKVTQSTFPLTIEFDACRSFLVEALGPNSSSKNVPFICAPPRTHRKAWYLSRVDR
jgi:hypothetical protein